MPKQKRRISATGFFRLVAETSPKKRQCVKDSGEGEFRAMESVSVIAPATQEKRPAVTLINDKIVTPPRRTSIIKDALIADTQLFSDFQSGDLLYGLSGTKDYDLSRRQSIRSSSCALTRIKYFPLLRGKHSRSFITIDDINNGYVYAPVRFIAKGDVVEYNPPSAEELAAWPEQARSFYSFLTTNTAAAKFSPLNPENAAFDYDWHISAACKAAFLWAAHLANSASSEKFTIRILLGGVNWQRIVSNSAETEGQDKCSVTREELRFLHTIWDIVPGIKAAVRFYDDCGKLIDKDFNQIWAENLARCEVQAQATRDIHTVDPLICHSAKSSFFNSQVDLGGGDHVRSIPSFNGVAMANKAPPSRVLVF